MSRSSHHILALLPLFSILTMSPMQLETKAAYRSIASVTEIKEIKTPKYQARAAKIDRTKIVVDKDMDLDCFSQMGEAYRNKLLQERKDYKVDIVDKDAVAAQKKRVDDLVLGLVELEEDVKFLKAKNAWIPQGEEIAMNTMNELKITLESLLQDEIENDLAVLQDQIKKDEGRVVVAEEPKKEEPKTEEPKKEEPQSEDQKKICDLEEKNKVLSKQVEDLLAEQKKIMETMLGMNNMMIQMNQRMQQPQYSIPSWLMAGSLVNPQLQYPYMASPTIIMIGGQNNQLIQPDFIGGQQRQGYGQYQFPQPMPMPQQYYPMQTPYSQPVPYNQGSFGTDPSMYNFGQAPTNQLPIFS